MKSELKPCPFCGNKAILVFKKYMDEFLSPIKYNDIKKNNGKGYFQVFCKSVSCCMTRYSTIGENVIKAWNQRAKECKDE